MADTDLIERLADVVGDNETSLFRGEVATLREAATALAEIATAIEATIGGGDG